MVKAGAFFSLVVADALLNPTNIQYPIGEREHGISENRHKLPGRRTHKLDP